MRLGRLLGCTVSISPWSLAVLALYAALGQPGPVLVAYALLVTHELAHLLVARGFGLEVAEVELWPFGGIARVPGLEAAEPAVVALVAVAGPLHHFFLLGLGELLDRLGLLHPVYGRWFLQANLLLGVLNLLPALPLDGGRVLHAYLRAARGEREAARWAVYAGYVTAAAMAAAAGIALAYGLLLPELAVLAVVVAAGARREAVATLLLTLRPLWRRGQELRRAGTLPVQAWVAPAGLRVLDLAARLTPRRYLLVWVLDDALRPLGVLDEGRLRQALLSGRHGATLAEVLGRE